MVAFTHSDELKFARALRSAACHCSASCTHSVDEDWPWSAQLYAYVVLQIDSDWFHSSGCVFQYPCVRGQLQLPDATDRDGVTLGVRVGVSVVVPLGVRVELGVAVPLWLGVAPGVAVRLALGAAVRLGVTVPVGSAVAL